MAFLAASLLLLSVPFCDWSQALDISVESSNGMPVSGADVKITYQKANGVTSDDGLVKEKTGEDGHYRITLANTVPAGELENRHIEVDAGFGSWQGKQQSFEADSGTLEVLFVASMAFEQIKVIALQSDGKAAAGASVYVSGLDIKKTADSSGAAFFYLPEDEEVSGFVSYGSQGEYFTSERATAGDGGGREILVRLPKSGGQEAYEGSATLSVTFVGLGNEPLAGERVVFYYDGAETPIYADARGTASLDFRGSGEAFATVKKNGYDYLFSYNVTSGQGMEETAALYPLLKIDYLESSQEGEGCYKVLAKVSDPRINRPISVKIMQVREGPQTTELPVEIDENGFYSTRICASPDTLVKAVASNTYETSERTISLSYAAPLPSPEPVVPPGGADSTMPQPIRPTSPTEGLEVIVVLIVLLAVVFGAAMLMLGKKDPQAAGGMMKYFTHGWGMMLGSTVRPIVEYLRSLVKKKEPPAGGPMFPRS